MMDDRAWRTSSYSGGQGNCVEVADHGKGVLVRDTKDRTGPVLRFSPAAWRRFAGQVKRSLAPDPRPSLLGHSRVCEGAPFAWRGFVSSLQARAPVCGYAARRAALLATSVCGRADG